VSSKQPPARDPVSDVPTVPSASDLLRLGQTHERGGAMAEALQAYAAAIESAERNGDQGVLAEALRRMGVVHHHRNEGDVARSLCQRSYETAIALGTPVLAAEALNALAGFDFEAGFIKEAREKFYRALELGGASAQLRGRTEQNLGILANIQGALSEALAHYQRSPMTGAAPSPITTWAW
jgi:tetratricopeptide (TPR) repeat protein